MAIWPDISNTVSETSAVRRLAGIFATCGQLDASVEQISHRVFLSLTLLNAAPPHWHIVSIVASLAHCKEVFDIAMAGHAIWEQDAVADRDGPHPLPLEVAAPL